MNRLRKMSTLLFAIHVVANNNVIKVNYDGLSKK